jgi:signal transduction histidine kinase
VPAATAPETGHAQMRRPPRLHLLDELPGAAAATPMAELIDTAPALLFACSPDGSDAWVNRQWLSYTGVADLDALATHWFEFTVAGDGSPLASPAAAAEGACVETPFRLRDANGEYRWQLSRARLAHDPQGRVLFWAGVVQELVPRPAGAEAHDSAIDKDEFFALVSHELRSPLNAIRGWAHVLRKSGELSPMQERALATIDRNVAAQASLIDDLLDRQRLLHGHVRLERRRIALAELVAGAIDGIRPAAAEKQLQLTSDCPESIVLDADPQRLNQVLVNLLSNAVKFTPAQGHVEVRARRSGDQVLVDVADSGIGLAPEWVLRAFAPRTRGSGAAPTGPGLGLTLAQRLIELHGGRLSATSDGPDRGSTFRIELPAPPNAADPAASHSEAAAW